jgi:hypothetical protein
MQILDNLQAYRLQTDILADSVAANIFKNGSNPLIYSTLHSLVYNSDTFSAEQVPDYLQDYFAQTAILPSWFDTTLQAKAVAFFEKNVENIMMLLGVYSLPYCYAAADGARVLLSSKRITEQTRKRLAETAQFVLEVMQPDAFLPTGKALRSIQKVRLMHAVVRYQILQKGNWDLAWGKPINQEDMAGTNLAFSFIILQGLRKIGASVSFEDAKAFLHHWAVVGYLLGLDKDLLVFHEREADLLCKKIVERNFKSSEQGIALTLALLDSFKETPPFNVLKGFAATYIRYLVGDEIANLLV